MTLPYYNPYAPSGAMPDALTQYKAQYQQPMQMPYHQPQMPMQGQIPPQSSSGLLFVLGESDAQSYPVAPNNTVVLWDKNNTTLYIKTVDAQGIPSMQIFDYTERTQNAPQKGAEIDYVKRADFDALKKEFEALRSKIPLASHYEEKEDEE